MTKEMEKMINNIKAEYQKELAKVKEFYEGKDKEIADLKFENNILKQERDRLQETINLAYQNLNYVGFINGKTSRERAKNILSKEFKKKC